MYSGIASSITSNTEKGLTNIDSISGISFNSNWSSTASDYMMESLDLSIEGFNNLMNNLGLFNEALVLTDEYKRIVEEIERLQSILVNIVGDDKEAQAARASLEAKIAALMSQKKEVRAKIEGILSSIGVVDVDNSTINLSTNANGFQYLIDPRELCEMLSKIFSCGNIALNLDGGQEYVDSCLGKILSTYSGREAAVNYCLMAGLLSVEAGVLIPYENPGQNWESVPYNNSKQLVDGMDCCSGVSLFVNAGTPNQTGFQWGHVATFRDIAQENDLYVNIEDSLPGDVLVDNSDDFNHVSMVLMNDTEKGMITIGQFSGNKGHFNIITMPYSSYSQYNAVDMSGYYNGDLVHKWA